MRMIIAGSRTIRDEAAYQALKATVMRGPKPELIIHGGAIGPDLMGKRLADEFGIPTMEFKPNWEAHGKSAGFIRNGDMAVFASEDPSGEQGVLVTLWDGSSSGTANMRSCAATYNLMIVDVPVQSQLLSLRDVTPPPPKIFAQSHSSLGVFATCPRQYEAKYITREVQFVQGTAAKWGDDVHIALDQYLLTRGAAQLPANMQPFQKWGDRLLNRAAARGGQLLSERSSAVNQNKQPVAYKDKTAWVRGKIDVTIVYPHEGVAEVYDWKTGKMKNDVTQLQLYGGFAFADYPEVHTVKAGYVWLGDDTITPPVFFQRQDLAQLWDTFDHKYAQLKDAYVRGVFPATPNPLCAKWCDVVSCEYHGRGRRG